MSSRASRTVIGRTALLLCASLGAACARGGEPTGPFDSSMRADGAAVDGAAVDGAGGPSEGGLDAPTPDLDAALDATASGPEAGREAGPVGDGGGVCTNNLECAGTATPVCDTTARRCVECLVGMEASCGAGRICDAMTRRCVAGCRADRDCMNAASMADAGVLDDGGTAPAALRCLLAERRCVECVLSDDCPPGLLCTSNRCVPGCTPSRPCPGGAACCSGVCTDLNTTTTSCGACGTSCESGQACCTGACTNIQRELENCGACGRRCEPAHAMGRCAMGVCQVGACEAGWVDLDGNGENGCECNAGETAPSCEGARGIDAVSAGGMQMASAVVVRPGADAWFRVGIAGGGFPRIRFETNPGSKLRFEVRSGCGGGPTSCSDRTEGATGLTEWDFRDAPGTHTTRAVPYPNALFIRVFATEALDGCMPFSLIVQN